MDAETVEPVPPLPAPLTRDGVALAHHRYYCHGADPCNTVTRDASRLTCTEVDEYDYDYADTLAEVLALMRPT